MNKIKVTLILILILAAFLRFYNLANIAKFEYDEQYNSYLVYDLVKNHHLSLIGQQGSFGGIYWGPWHYLYLTPFYFITNLHPIGGFIGEAVLGLLTIVSYFYIGSKLFSPKVGLLAAFLRSILFITLVNDLTISPAYPSELVAIWFFYFLVKLRQGSQLAFVILSFLFGLMFSVHVVLFPLVLVWILTMLVFRPIKFNLRLIVQAILAMIIPISPLIIFEVRHHFDHVRLFLNTLVGDNGYNPIIPRFMKILSYNLDSFYRIFDRWLLPNWLGIVVFTTIILLLWRKKGLFKNSFYFFLFLSTFIIEVLYYTFYPRNVSEYYYLGLTPLIILFVSALYIELWRYKLGKVLMGIFLMIILYTNFKLYLQLHSNRGGFSLSDKEKAVRSIIDHQKGKGEYSVSYLTDIGRNYGFQYLFTYFGSEPRKYISIPVYTIVVPVGLVAKEDLSALYGSIGVIFPEDEPEQGR